MYSSVRKFGTLSKHIPSAFDIAIVGGGTAGMNIAWKLGRYYKKLNIALIEPSLVSFKNFNFNEQSLKFNFSLTSFTIINQCGL